MNVQSRAEFKAYLVNCTDTQVRGVYEKELQAGRDDYADLAELEAMKRGIELS